MGRPRVRAFDPYSLAPVTGDHLVGREREKNLLQRYLSESPGVILLTGERGIGKTSLLHELPNLVEPRAMAFPEVGPARWGFWDAVGAPLESLVGVTKSKTRLGWKLGLDPARLFGKPPVPDPTPPFSVELEVGREQLPEKRGLARLQALCDGVAKHGRQVCVRVQDAFLWAEQEQLMLLELVARTKCLYAVLEVPDTRRDAVSRGAARAAKEVRVGRLALEEARAVVDRGGFLTEEQSAQVVELSECSPYYLQSICFVLWERFQQAEENGVSSVLARLDSAADLNARLELVHTEVRETLAGITNGLVLAEAAAVAPVRSTERILKEFSGLERRPFRSALRELKKRWVLVEQDKYLALYHGLFREYLQRVNDQPASEMEAKYMRTAELLAASEEVGLLLREQVANSDLLMRLVGVVHEPKSLNEVAHVLVMRCEFGRGERVYRRLFEVAEQGSFWQLAALNNATRIYFESNNLRGLHELISAAVGLWRKTRDVATAIPILANMGIVSAKLGDVESAAKLLNQALELSQDLDYRPGVMLVELNLGTLRVDSDPEEAIQHLMSAKGVADSLQDEENLVSIEAGLGHACCRLQRWDDAEQWLKQALVRSRRSQALLLTSKCLHNLGYVCLEQGRVEEALGHLLEEYDIVTRAGLQPAALEARGALMLVLQRIGEENFRKVCVVHGMTDEAAEKLVAQLAQAVRREEGRRQQYKEDGQRFRRLGSEEFIADCLEKGWPEDRARAAAEHWEKKPSQEAEQEEPQEPD